MASKPKKATRTRRTKKASEKARLDALVEEATVDAHDGEEQLMGLFSLRCGQRHAEQNVLAPPPPARTEEAATRTGP
jgi:hypothetical protein